jgi:AcrR family transcriptional regulator
LQTSPQPHRDSAFPTAEDRERERRQKREAVLRTAASLFCTHGYSATQMSDVARQLGVTKPTIYYYFKNKEEVLVACFEAGFELMEATLLQDDMQGRTGAERLRRALYAYAEIMTMDLGKCAALIPTTDLSEENRGRINGHRRKFDDRIRTLVAAAVADGTIRPCDPKIATFAVLGGLNGLARWHRADGPLPPAELAQTVVDQLFAGFEKR